MNDGRCYCGITSDIVKRMIQHNLGQSKSTKNHRPIELIHKENHGTMKEARRKEVRIKKQGVTRWYNKNIKFAS